MKPDMQDSGNRRCSRDCVHGLYGSSAHAQAFSFGYSGPGGSVGVNMGNYGYFGGGGYYGGGYYGGYPVVGPRAFIAGPVPPVYVRPQVYPRWTGRASPALRRRPGRIGRAIRAGYPGLLSAAAAW